MVLELIDATPHWLHNEAVLAGHWNDWLREVQAALPHSQGRLVKAVGDACMLRFEHVADAISCGLLLLQRWPTGAESVLPGLRAAVHAAPLLIASEDLYGSGANLSARLCSLAGAGQLAVSASSLQGLAPAQVALFRDLGRCYLKHWPTAVHALVCDAATSAPAAASAAASLQPPPAHTRRARGPS